jgi:hypothetical protein
MLATAFLNNLAFLSNLYSFAHMLRRNLPANFAKIDRLEANAEPIKERRIVLPFLL